MKKAVSFLSVFLFLFIMFPMQAFAADGIIEIRTPADLDNVRNNLSGNFILMDDIVFTETDFSAGGAFYNRGGFWQPIGAGGSNTAFSGTLDGNGHCIQGLKIFRLEEDNTGLFTYITGTVKNLLVKDADIFGHRSVGGICGTLGVGGIIEGCTFDGVAEGNNAVAGMAGFLNSGRIVNCRNSGRIISQDSCAGGIVGDLLGGSGIDVSDCENTGTIEAYQRAGGIIGYATGNAANCINRGKVKASLQAAGIAGGLAGSIEGCKNYGQAEADKAAGIVEEFSDGTISKCANFSSVVLPKKCTYGGIAAVSTGFIKECYNVGNIDVKNYEAVAGGIAGTLTGGMIKDSFNTGNIFSSHVFSKSVPPATIGGIAGFISGTGRNIINCYNTGYIQPAKKSGDIVGERLGGSSQYAYYLKDAASGIAALAVREGETPKTLAEMCKPSTYAGFDFSAVWETAANSTPRLKNTGFVYPTGISIGSKLDIAVKKVKKLAVTAAPSSASNKNVLWKSSNSRIASVNAKGEVSAKAIGKAVITAVSTSSNSVKATCTIRVVRPSTAKLGTPKVNLSKTDIKKAVLSGVVKSTGGLEIEECGFVLSATKNPSLGGKGVKRLKAKSGGFTAAISSLKAGTRYYVRAYAKNAKGIAYSPQKEFKTYKIN